MFTGNSNPWTRKMKLKTVQLLLGIVVYCIPITVKSAFAIKAKSLTM